MSDRDAWSYSPEEARRALRRPKPASAARPPGALEFGDLIVRLFVLGAVLVGLVRFAPVLWALLGPGWIVLFVAVGAVLLSRAVRRGSLRPERDPGARQRFEAARRWWWTTRP